MSETYLCSSEQFTLARVWTTSTYWNSRICWIRRKKQTTTESRLRNCERKQGKTKNTKYNSQRLPGPSGSRKRPETSYRFPCLWLLEAIKNSTALCRIRGNLWTTFAKNMRPSVWAVIGGAWILRLNSVDSMPAMIFPQLNWGCGSPSARDVSMFQCMVCLKTATSSMSLWWPKVWCENCAVIFHDKAMVGSIHAFIVCLS